MIARLSARRSPSRPGGRRQRGFTLLETVVTLVVVSMLVAMLMQALNQALSLRTRMLRVQAEARTAFLQEAWFRGFLKLPHGVPSHDTFERVFQMLDAEQLERGFIEWTTALSQHRPGDVVPIDGKTIRNSGSALRHP